MENEIAMTIVEKNRYMVIATFVRKDIWIAPVMYWIHNNHFYFVSDINSMHVKHIIAQPNVAVSIHDTNIPEGKGDKTGIQFNGIANIFMSKKNILDNDEIIDILRSGIKRFPQATLEELKLRCIQWYENNRVIGKIIPNDILFLNSYDGKKDIRIPVKFTRSFNVSQFRSKL